MDIFQFRANVHLTNLWKSRCGGLQSLLICATALPEKTQNVDVKPGRPDEPGFIYSSSSSSSAIGPNRMEEKMLIIPLFATTWSRVMLFDIVVLSKFRLILHCRLGCRLDTIANTLKMILDLLELLINALTSLWRLAFVVLSRAKLYGETSRHVPELHVRASNLFQPRLDGL